MKKVNYIPEGYNTITPYLVIKGAAKAIDYYKKVFGATVVVRMDGPDGKVGHAELQIGDSRIMLADENPAMGNRSAENIWRLSGEPVRLPARLRRGRRKGHCRGGQNFEAGAGSVLWRSLWLHPGSVRASLGRRNSQGRCVAQRNERTRQESDAGSLKTALGFWLLAPGLMPLA